MPLTLLAGPANSGKVAALLDRYLASIHEDPLLIVPNRPDVDRIERDPANPEYIITIHGYGWRFAAPSNSTETA